MIGCTISNIFGWLVLSGQGRRRWMNKWPNEVLIFNGVFRGDYGIAWVCYLLETSPYLGCPFFNIDQSCSLSHIKQTGWAGNSLDQTHRKAIKKGGDWSVDRTFFSLIFHDFFKEQYFTFFFASFCPNMIQRLYKGMPLVVNTLVPLKTHISKLLLPSLLSKSPSH